MICAVVALIDCWRGRPGQADEDIAAAVELARLGGSSATLADALRVQATIDALRGRLDRARDTLVREIPELGIAEAGRLIIGTGVVLGFVAHSSGDAAGADELYTRTTAALEGAGILEMPGYLYQGDHVEALLALGDVDRAEAIVAALEARAAVFARPSTLVLAARCRGLVLAVRGDLDGALEAMEVALTHHERLDYPYELGRTLMAKAQVHRRRTEKRLARDALERAVELLQRRRRGDLGGAGAGGARPAPLPGGPDRPDRDGAAHRRARGGGPYQPRDRERDVRQPEDRRGPPGERLRKARDPVARGARRVDGGASRAGATRRSPRT